MGSGEPRAWTPKSGVASLLERFDVDAVALLLDHLLSGDVGHGELTEPPYRKVLLSIGDRHAAQLLRQPVSRKQLYWVRSWAARAMAYLGDREVQTPLTRALEDPHWRVRMTAAQSLGRLRLHGAKQALQRILQDEHKRVRDAATLALRRIAEQCASVR